VKLPPHLSIKNSHLHIDGQDCVALAQRYGTPLYVTSEDRVCEQYMSYQKALSRYYPKVSILFAAKANGNLAIIRALARLGAGADVFSSGELHLALEAGMPAEKLLFNGSSKTPEDLKLAVETGVKVSVDSLDELHQLDNAAKRAGKTAKIAFRVNPALEVPTHPKIATGLATSKFGIPHKEIPAAYREAPAPTPGDYAAKVVPVFKAGIEACGITPELWVEPGRSLVADSTVLLTRVNSTKSAHKKFANVDAGFNLLIRPAMYDAFHEVIVANRADAPLTAEYTVTGPICETGDILAADRKLPPVVAGDTIAVLDAGAYGFAMSSQYNCRPRCPEVLIHGTQVSLMRRGENLGDITAAMQRPSWQR